MKYLKLGQHMIATRQGQRLIIIKIIIIVFGAVIISPIIYFKINCPTKVWIHDSLVRFGKMRGASEG